MTNLIHSVQRALLANVGVHVVGVAVHDEPTAVIVEAFVTEGLTEDEHEGLEVALTEVIADLPNPVQHPARLVIKKLAGTHLVSKGDWAYVRLGLSVSQSLTSLYPAVAEESRAHLDSDRRVAFLLAVAAELTLAARDSYVEAGSSVADSQRLLRCLNELQIVVGKQLVTAVTGTAPAYPDGAFLTVLEEKAAIGGCLSQLQHALHRAGSQTSPGQTDAVNVPPPDSPSPPPPVDSAP